ncbi:MAG TPA: D-xylose ABC transporter substrate-binding protein, partial [Acidimicrobiia bacterium]|nr:D-xylose ABC transporter substrate-binding protein [Acidimicrobiia bacterium]
AGGAELADIENTVEFESPGGNTMISIFLDPNPITQDNLQEVIDAEVISQEDLCQGVEAGTVDVCS